MAKMCLCLTGETLAADLAVLEKHRRLVDIAELRVDCLKPEERFHIRRFPEMAGLPVILTIRRESDGGKYSGGEWSRVGMLSRGLAFADIDRRRNFAYVDLEDDLNIPGIEEAARTFDTRIIRSYHNTEGMDDCLVARIKNGRRVGDELVKVAVTPTSLDDVTKLFKAAKETAGIDKILIGMGDFGLCTRILAELLGSYLSYTSDKSEGTIAAPGHIDPVELAEKYRFKSITSKTRIFGISGFPLLTTASPAFFNAVFKLENTDAVYIPFPARSIEAFLHLAEEIALEGASITVPHKETVLPHLTQKSTQVAITGACNTLIRGETGWEGHNTDAPGFSDSLLEFMGKKDLKGKRVTIVGAGGAAQSVAAEVYRLKGKALILNRHPFSARRMAERFDFRWGALDAGGAELINRFNDIIIQTTPVGMAPDLKSDPLEMYRFSGKEIVMDVIYKPEMTAFLKRAFEAGCRTLNGHAMFIKQAQSQYRYFMGRDFPPQLMSRISL